MRISIAMTTYNGAKYLQEQLDSFLYQTRQPDELVVCDDGSTDGTLEILEDFRRQAPFAVRVYRNQTNLGYTKNFEKALKLCTGEIIFLSDQDDVWFCHKVETMAEILAIRPEIFVLQTDMVLADEFMNPHPYTQLGNIIAVGQSQDMFVAGCGTAVRREWLDEVLPIPSDVVTHDNWLHRLALSLGVRELHFSPLQYYRRHGDNASNSLISKPVMMTEMDAFYAHGLRDATGGWLNELQRVKATISRLNERAATLRSLALMGRRAAAMVVLVRHMKDLNSRIHNMTIPRSKRWLPVLVMWLRGGYRNFAGWKSVAKDIVRS